MTMLPSRRCAFTSGRVLVLAVALAAVGGCETRDPQSNGERAGGDSPATKPLHLAFSEERAWAHLQDLCRMGPRAHGAEGHRRAREYIRRELEGLGARYSEMRFPHVRTGETLEREFTNLVARFGADRDRWILLGTHYDTRLWADEDPDPAKRDSPIEGANDGGSGVAVLLETARVVAENSRGTDSPGIGIEFVFFDGEDFGRRGSSDYFLGSRHYASRWSEFHPGSAPAAVVILDMVGDHDLEFLRDDVAGSRWPWLQERIWESAGQLRETAFAQAGSKRVTDDHTAFQELGMPATLLIDFSYPHWHTAADTLDKCAARSLGATGRVLLAALVDQGLPR